MRGKRQSLESVGQPAWDAEGGAVEEGGGGGAALWLPPGMGAGTDEGSGTEGRTRGNQQPRGQDCTTRTVWTKGLIGEAGKQSQ